MPPSRPTPSSRQQLPWQGQLYAIRVLFTVMVLVMLAVSDAVCRNQPAAHLWLLVAGAIYPHLGQLLLGRFESRRRRGHAILVIDGLFAGAVIGAIGVVSMPSAVLATVSLFNWMIIGGPPLVAMGMIATVIGIAAAGPAALFPAAAGTCPASDGVAGLVLLGYFLVIASFIYRHIGGLRQQQAALQADADAAAAARTVADRALLGVLPPFAAEALAVKGELPPLAMDSSTLLLVEFVWSRGEAPSTADLAEIFQICDTILSRHKLEGIKTFGRHFLAIGRATGGPDNAVAAIRELHDHLGDHRALVGSAAAQRSIRAALHCGPITAGLVQPERLNLDLQGEAVEALHALANIAATRPANSIVASAAAHRRLQHTAGFVATGDADTPQFVLDLTASP